MKLKSKSVRITGAVVVLTGVFSIFAFNSPNERYFEITKNLDIFTTLFKEVNAYYVDEVNPAELMNTGIEAMLSSLDPYTNYIPEDEIEDYRTMTTGQYGGIGAVIGKNQGKNMVIMPYEGFPAHNAGLKIGDEILQVDGIDVSDKSTSEISQLLKGQAKKPVEITVRRYGQDKPMTFELIRDKIKISNVPYYGLVRDNVGYIKLSDFTQGAGKEVANAVEALKSEGAKKIVLDLRDNPGGLLVEAVNVSNVFVPKGKEIVSTKGKVTDWNKSYNTLNNGVDTEIPLAVLTSSRSASASEIVSGVVQDYDRGVLVGERTFGKGLVQATRPLTYNSQLKVTTAKYYIPSGRCIQAINYSEKNEDGSVSKIPDSLKVAFKTSNGRTVYDGGGVLPDMEVENRTLTPISVSLVANGLIFDYATIYYYEYPEIKDAKQFKLTDEEYQAFVTWLKDKEYDYTTRVEKTIDNLIEYAKKEKYFERIETQIESLREEVQHNKEHDLKQFQDEVQSILEEEIASRYFLRDGRIEAGFDDDPQLQSAIEILNRQEEYDQILAKNIE